MWEKRWRRTHLKTAPGEKQRRVQRREMLRSSQMGGGDALPFPSPYVGHSVESWYVCSHLLPHLTVCLRGRGREARSVCWGGRVSGQDAVVASGCIVELVACYILMEMDGVKREDLEEGAVEYHHSSFPVAEIFCPKSG